MESGVNQMTGSRRRSIALLGTVLLLAFIAVPYFGRAQESTPESASSPQAVDDGLIGVGEAIFLGLCVACHQQGGAGIDGVYPALAGNPLVTLDDPEIVTETVLYGHGGMPRFNDDYSDLEIAAVVSYIRTNLEGNNAAPITPEYVTQLQDEAGDASATPQALAPGQVLEPGQINSPQIDVTPEATP